MRGKYEEDIETAKSGKDAGPDGVPMELLKL